MLVSAAAGTAFQYRTAAGASAGSVSGSSSAVAPQWLKIVRAGATISGYQSADGSTWQLAGSVAIDMGSTVEIGVAVASHDNTKLCKATFDHVGP